LYGDVCFSHHWAAETARRKRAFLFKPFAYRLSPPGRPSPATVRKSIYCPPVPPALPELRLLPDEDALPADPPVLLVPVESLAAPFKGAVDDEPDAP
jgi:hypothetical protein